MFKEFHKRKQEKMRARREGGEQWVSVLPQDREINAETAAERHGRDGEAISTPWKAKHGH